MEYVDLASSIAYKRDLDAPNSHLSQMTTHPPLVTAIEIVQLAKRFLELSRKDLVRKLRDQDVSLT